jgi:hypothetical protein
LFTWWGGTTSSKFSVTSTGAATFSSTVTANGGFYLPAGSFGTSPNFSYTNSITYGLNSTGGNAGVYFGNQYNSSLATAMQLRVVDGGGTNISAMTITSGGNVLIGTTTDAGYKLDVNGTGRFSGALAVQNSRLGLGIRTANRGELFINSSATAEVSEIFLGYGNGYTEGNIRWAISDRGTASGNLVFFAGPAYSGGFANIFQLASTGEATFSSSVTAGTSNQYKTEINTNSNAPGINIQGGSSSNTAQSAPFVQIYDQSNNRAWVTQIDASYQYATFYYGGSSYTKVGYQTTGGTWTNSDERRKENIEICNYGLNEVLQLIPKKFNFKIDERKIVNLGFIAQDVLPIIPESVQADIDNEEEYYAMNYSNLVPVLVKAIQEQQSQIEELKALIK